MKCLDDHHNYELESFEGSPPQDLKFINKVPVPDNSGQMRTVHDGTTNEEVLKVLIHRTNELNKKFPCRENSIAITKMEEALMWFNNRTRDRQIRGVEGMHKA